MFECECANHDIDWRRRGWRKASRWRDSCHWFILPALHKESPQRRAESAPRQGAHGSRRCRRQASSHNLRCGLTSTFHIGSFPKIGNALFSTRAVQYRPLFKRVQCSALSTCVGASLIAQSHASVPPVGAPTHQQCCMCVLGLSGMLRSDRTPPILPKVGRSGAEKGYLEEVTFSEAAGRPRD